MNGLLLLKNDTAKPIELKQATPDNMDGEIDFRDFLSTLLSNIDKNTMKEVDTNELISKKIDKKIDLDKNLPLDKSQKAEDLLINDLLKFVLFLKSNGLNGHFPKESGKLVDILKNEEAIKDFKSVKSLEDILKVAKKYDIKIKKFDISLLSGNKTKEIETKLTTIETKTPKDNQTGKIKITSEKILSNIKHIKQPKQTKKVENHDEILSKLINKSDNDKSAIHLSTKNSKNRPNTKVGQNIKSKVKHQKAKEQVIVKNESIDNNKKDISILKDAKKLKEDILSRSGHEEIKEKKDAKITPKATITKDNTRERNKLLKPETNTAKNIKHHTKQAKELNTTINNTDETQKKEEIIPKHKDTISLTPKHEVKAGATTQKNINTKPINSFANDLRERIENYKPPIMKIKMTLTPKDLGSVDVTMINRGNNLQVTISSNSNTMAIFTQNQAEFKNSLVNMGFTNLSMNFSSQNDHQKNNQKEQSKKQSNFMEEVEELSNDSIDMVELTIPRYI